MSAPLLLVEDDRDTRESIVFLLEADGYSVITATDGEEALTLLRDGLRPCLILLDLMMPVKDGFQFRKEQRADPRIADIPVAVYSGHYDPQAHAAELHATAYLRKPVDVERLVSVIRQHCDA